MNVARCACGKQYSTDNYDAGMCDDCMSAAREKDAFQSKRNPNPINHLRTAGIQDLKDGDIFECELTSGWIGVRYFRGWQPVKNGFGGCALISAKKTGRTDKMPPDNFVWVKLLDGGPTLPKLLDALGWQGGTVSQAFEEVRRLRAQSVAHGQAALIDAFVKGAKWWEFESTGGAMWPSDQHKAHDAGRRKYPDPPLGQGVAALLPDHGEVKRGRRCKRDGKYLVAGSLNQVPYDGQGEPMLFSDDQCVSLDRLGYDVEPSHGAWA